ncbi:Polyadenylate-binding protein 2 [Glycine max]|nr:Polyadenylate-binding protein 2 [Glycine max]
MTRVQVLPQNAIPDPNGGGAAGNQFVMTSLYVRDLDPNVMDAQLYDLVNQLGQVVSVRVCRDLTSRRSLGYDYVNFSNPQDVAVLLSYYIFTRLSRRNLTNEVDSNFF